MAKIKAKLEATLDDLEDSLEQEKKLRLDQERNRRKAEAEVKSMQAAIEAVERSKKESDAATIRKEKEISALSDKLDSEQTNLLKSNKQIKECGVNITKHNTTTYLFILKVQNWAYKHKKGKYIIQYRKESQNTSILDCYCYWTKIPSANSFDIITFFLTY